MLSGRAIGDDRSEPEGIAGEVLAGLREEPLALDTCETAGERAGPVPTTRKQQ